MQDSVMNAHDILDRLLVNIETNARILVGCKMQARFDTLIAVRRLNEKLEEMLHTAAMDEVIDAL